MTGFMKVYIMSPNLIVCSWDVAGNDSSHGPCCEGI